MPTAGRAPCAISRPRYDACHPKRNVLLPVAMRRPEFLLCRPIEFAPPIQFRHGPRQPGLGLDELPHAEEYETLAGFLMVMLRRVPRRTDSVSVAGYKFEVLDVDSYRIDQVMVSRLDTAQPLQAAVARS